jgi:hypothetical protein
MSTTYQITYLLNAVDLNRNWETMLTRTGELPFFPIIGMSIDTGEGNLRKVNDVYYTCEPPELTVFFDDENDYSLDTLLGWGWKEN